MYIRGMSCCGVRKLHSLCDHMNKRDGRWSFSSTEALRDFEEEVYNDADGSRWRFAVFTQATPPHPSKADVPFYTYGERFATFIRRHGLGEVVETQPAVNPNTNNTLKVWVWTVDHTAVKNFLKQKKGTK